MDSHFTRSAAARPVANSLYMAQVSDMLYIVRVLDITTFANSADKHYLSGPARGSRVFNGLERQPYRRGGARGRVLHLPPGLLRRLSGACL